MPTSVRLAEMDDMLTLLLIDFGIFHEPSIQGRRTTKMRGQTRDLRIPKADREAVGELVKELREGTVSVSEGTRRFCEIKVVKAFMQRGEGDGSAFEVAVRRYISALRPDVGIVFNETDRYSSRIKSAYQRQTPSPTPPPTSDQKPIQVGVYSTRKFKKGDEIFLKGGTADLSEEEDDELRVEGHREFSVLWSSRKNCFGLLLGPARFVNHDCRNNVVFNLTGNHMSFKVVEDIEADEQLFTHYGEHYFDVSNRSCLCSTCQQLKRGAFAPPVSIKAAPSPTRRSSRSGLGHELMAQRSVSRTARSNSISSLSSLSSSRASSPDTHRDKRRSERTAVVGIVDELRTFKRVVHPRLKPPPGYSAHFRWEARRSLATYIGPVSTPRIGRSTSILDGSLASKVAFLKRKREDSPDFPPNRRPKDSRESLPKRRKTSPIRRPINLGTRTSSRSAAAIFARLEAQVGYEDSDLSELSDSDHNEEESDADEVGEDSDYDLSPIPLATEEKVEEAEPRSSHSLKDLTTSTRVLGIAPLTTADESDDAGNSGVDAVPLDRLSPELLPPPVGAELQRIISPELLLFEEVAPTTPQAPSEAPTAPSLLSNIAPDPGSSLSPRRHSCRPSSSAPSVADSFQDAETAHMGNTTGQTSSTGGDNSKETTASVENGAGRASTSDSSGTIGGTSGGAVGGASGGDDDDKDRKPVPPSALVDESEGLLIERGDQEQDDEDTAMKDDDVRSVAGTVAPSESGLESLSGRDEGDKEAANLLLFMLAGAGDLPFDASAAVLSPSPSTHGLSPPLVPPSPPPGTGSSKASTASTDAFDTPNDAGLPKRGTKRSRPSSDADKAPRIPHNPRSTRRNPAQADPVPESELSIKPTPSKPTVDVNVEAGPAPRSTEEPPLGSDKKRGRSTLLARHSTDSDSGSPRGSSREGSTERRGTRRSEPIPLDIRQLMASREVMGVAGGYDPTSGKYITTKKAILLGDGESRGRSAPPLIDSPKSRAKSRQSSFNSLEPRGTRSSNPLPGDIVDLMASPEVASVSGGYDPTSGKYFSKQTAPLHLSSLSPKRRRSVSSSEGATPHPSSRHPSPELGLGGFQASVASPSLDPNEGRGTRRTQPITQALQDLLASPHVASVSGGFDPETGKYTSRKQGARLLLGSESPKAKA